MPRDQHEDPWDRFLARLDRAATWPRRASLRGRFVALLIAVAVIVGLAVWISNAWWRDDLPRSTIAAVALGLVVLIALWLFGTRGSKTALSILAASGAVLVAAGTALNLDQVLSDGPPPVGALVDCPELPHDPDFDGVGAPTELGYAHLRERASLHSNLLLRYPPGCELAFDGYCLGEPKDDWRFDVLDPVWFRVTSGEVRGYVASADLKSGPAGGNVKERCDKDRYDPGRPALTAPLRQRLTGPVEIAAAAPRAIQVGFAVLYRELPRDPTSARWHQIGIDLNTGDGVTAAWDSRSVPGQTPRRAIPVTLLAVPCLGLEFPSEEIATRTYLVANRGRPKTRLRDREPGSADAARQVACDNVER